MGTSSGVEREVTVSNVLKRSNPHRTLRENRVIHTCIRRDGGVAPFLTGSFCCLSVFVIVFMAGSQVSAQENLYTNQLKSKRLQFGCDHVDAELPPNTSLDLNQYLQSKNEDSVYDNTRNSTPINVGIVNSFLFFSNLLDKGYLGIGLSLDVYLTKNFAVKYQRNYWQMNALNPEFPKTPFRSTSAVIDYYLLQLDITLKRQAFFGQFGLVGSRGKIGAETRGGFTLGAGYRVYRYENLNLSAVIDRTYLGNFGLAHGEVWDNLYGLSVEISYRFQINNAKAKGGT